MLCLLTYKNTKYKSRIEILSRSGILVFDWFETVPYQCRKCVKEDKDIRVLEEDEEV